MTPSTLNTILIIVFVLVVLIAILAGVIGFLKGIYKTSLKTILKTILVVVLVFTTPSIAILVGKINIQGILQSDSAVTLQTWIANFVTESGLFSPINGIQIYEMAFVIATSLLSFAVFLFGMILIQIFIVPLTLILYQGIFRWILPVETPKERKFRKKNKDAAALKKGLVDEDNNILDKPRRKWSLFRIPSAIIGGIQEFGFVLILLTPIVSLATTALKNRDGIKNVMTSMDVSEENQNLVSSYLDTIENSWIYNLISFSKLDTTLINKATSVSVNGESISFNILVSSSFDLINPLLENETISYDSAYKKLTVNYSALMSLTTIDGIVDTLSSNPMLLALLPPLLDSAMNSISGDYFALNSLDFSNIDYSSEITVLRDIYSIVYDSGIKPLLNGNDFDFNHYVMKVSSFTDDDILSYVSAVRELGKMEVVRKNLPALLSSLGVYLNQKGYNIFPTEASAYENVDWSEDLAIITSVALKFFRLIQVDIQSKMDATELKNKIILALKDDGKREQIEEFMCSGDDEKGLLDTELFSIVSLPDILSSSFSTVPSLSEYSSQIDYHQIFSGYGSEDYKKEIHVLFDMLDVLFAADSKINVENFFSADFTDETVSAQIVDLLKLARNSRIFSSMYPTLLKTLLYSGKFNFSNYLFGLTPYNFNYSSGTFIDDFISLVEILPSIADMMKNLSDSTLSRKEKLESIDTALIEKMLTIITSSDFFNSDQLTGISSVKQKNINIQTVLSNFFSNDIFATIGFVTPDLQTMQNIDWIGTTEKRGEISNICHIVEDFKKNPYFGSSSKFNLKDIEDTSAFSDLITDGLESDLLHDSILNIIDDSMNQYLEKMGIHMSISEMRTELWIEESDEIADLISILQEFDFDDFDLKNMDLNLLNALLTQVRQMKLFDYVNTSNGDSFGSLLYHVLLKSDIQSLINLTTLDSSLFSQDASLWSVETSEYEYQTKDRYNNPVTKRFVVTSDGDISNLVKLMDIIRAEGTSAISSGIISMDFFDKTSVLMSSKFIRGIVGTCLQSLVRNLNVPFEFSSFLSSIDFSLFADLSEDDARKELNLLSDLTAYMQKMPDSDETYFSYLMDNVLKLNSTESVLNESSESLTMEDDLYQILDEMASSRLMNSMKDAIELSPLKIFIKAMISSLGMEKQVTLSSDEMYANHVLDGILMDVADDEMVIEISTLKLMLNTLQGYSFELEVGKSVSESAMSILLQTMNNSAIFHRYPIYVMKDAFEKLNINDYLNDPDDSSHVIETEFMVHLTTSKDDISYWQNDIDMLLKIAYGETSLSNLFEKDETLSAIDLSSTTVSLDFLYYLGNMNVLKEGRSYLVYNLINESCPSSIDPKQILKKSTSAPYGENEYVHRIEELFYQNPKLMNANGELDKEKALSDLTMIHDVFSCVLSELDVVSERKDINVDFHKLMSCCSSVDENGLFYRSDLASEFVAGTIGLLFENSHYLNYASLLSSLDFYKDDYLLVNPIEGEALNGLVHIVNIDLSVSKTYLTFAEIETILPCFGKNMVDESDLLALYFLSLDEYQSVGENSYVGMKLSDVIGKLPVCKVMEDSPCLLSSLVNISESYLLTHSYQDVVSSLDGLIK